MKKTININLNSFIFNIDEDAYNTLKVYLSKLEDHFLKQEEGAEIVKDIESRVAELFSLKINDNKQVINISDVEEVIKILGNVEDITGDKEKDIKEEQAKEVKTTKKLYRDPDSKLLGGVCSGIAEYTGINIVIWRILFLVFLFFSQIGIIVYLILWIAVPEAKTTAQKIEMKGGKITLSTIEKTVKQEFDDVKKNWKKMNTKKTADLIENLGKTLLSIIQILAQVFGKILGVAFLTIGAALIILFTISFISVGSENIYYSNGLFNTVSLLGLLQYITSLKTAWFLSITILIVLIIPVIAIINWGINLLFEVRTNKYLGFGTFAVWILAIIISVALSINISYSFKSLETKVVVENLIPDSTNSYNFKINPEYSNFVLPDADDIKSVTNLYEFVNSRSFIEKGGNIKTIPEIYFKIADDTVAYAKFTYLARGSSNRQAAENIKSIDYKYINDSSELIFNPYLNLKTKIWRAQEVKIDVYLPVGSRLTIDKKLIPMIYIENANDELKVSELTGKELIVTKQGYIIK